MKSYKLFISLFIIGLTLVTKTYTQTEVEAWGNLKGIRIDGQLINFESSIDVVNSDCSKINSTAKEKQHPKFDRQDNKQIITTQLDSFYIIEQLEDITKGSSKIAIQFTSKKRCNNCGFIF